MKETYSTPEVEIVPLDPEDVIACSVCYAECGGCPVDTGEVPIGYL
ncbi:MAG: hypothetical protein IJM71_07425 [Clostridia bacterium]|nr:hypothetical protein [Clostridia bacterium]